MATTTFPRYIQLWKKSYRVRVQIPAALAPLLPAPYTGKRELVKSLGTNCLRQAEKLARPIIMQFEAAIAKARNDEKELDRLVAIMNEILALGGGIYHETYHETIRQEVRDWLNRQSSLFAEAPSATVPQPAPVVTFDAMIAAWSVDPRRQSDDAIASMTRHTGALAKFIKHDDMARVTTEDLIRFRTY